MSETRIPIRNLYLMLCYAWETFPSDGHLDLSSKDFENSSKFFAQVLSAAFSDIKRRGLVRDYSEVTEEGRTLRGKVDFASTIKRVLIQNGKVSCTFDVLDIDNKPNQILKWAFRTLFRSSDIDKVCRELVHERLNYLQQVSDIEVSRRDFSIIRIHRNNSHYKLLLALCELLFELCVPDDSNAGKYQVPSLFKDEKLMAKLFEGFVLNFLKREQQDYKSVASQLMDWDAQGDKKAMSFLPKMKTDITLESSDKVTIIDTKFYAKMFDERYGSEKIKAGNLYQLMSYLRTKSKGTKSPLSGVLLYPENGRSDQLDYVIEGFPVTVASVDLAAPWEQVRTRLLGVLIRKPIAATAA